MLHFCHVAIFVAYVFARDIMFVPFVIRSTLLSFRAATCFDALGMATKPEVFCVSNIYITIRFQAQEIDFVLFPSADLMSERIKDVIALMHLESVEKGS